MPDKRTKCRSKTDSRGGYGYPHNGDYGEDGSMGPYGNIGGTYGGAYAAGYGGYGTYGAYTGEDGPLTYDINAEGECSEACLALCFRVVRAVVSDIRIDALWAET